jgi:hypothetical protein
MSLLAHVEQRCQLRLSRLWCPSQQKKRLKFRRHRQTRSPSMVCPRLVVAQGLTSCDADVMGNVVKLQKGFLLREERHVFHVLRTLPALRKKLSSTVLKTLLDLAFTSMCLCFWMSCVYRA